MLLSIHFTDLEIEALHAYLMTLPDSL